MILSGEFSDDDWRRLENFAQYADELLRTKFAQKGDTGELRVQSTEEGGLQFEARLPDWDDVTVFLHKFRPILLQNESTFFYKIVNILARELEHPYVRGFLQREKARYSGKILQSAFQITSNDIIINSEQAVSDWLNAYEYHRAEDKQALLEKVHTMFPLDASKVLFLSVLNEKLFAVYNVAGFIQVMVGKIPDMNITAMPLSDK
ncbi:hypothetical protein SE17_02260 [Kouleothrix aurantiaca]|uniref:Uncharacterized protein n=1 Tax=Kouleothrix aurantiaca TaxID=186479 RepID=A0A0P9DMJ3_9CHLR|nr:hypothetical protein SE17_02260 [Kouleothrix aurantiaca]